MFGSGCSSLSFFFFPVLTLAHPFHRIPSFFSSSSACFFFFSYLSWNVLNNVLFFIFFFFCLFALFCFVLLLERCTSLFVFYIGSALCTSFLFFSSFFFLSSLYLRILVRSMISSRENWLCFGWHTVYFAFFSVFLTCWFVVICPRLILPFFFSVGSNSIPLFYMCARVCPPSFVVLSLLIVIPSAEREGFAQKPMKTRLHM